MQHYAHAQPPHRNRSRGRLAGLKYRWRRGMPMPQSALPASTSRWISVVPANNPVRLPPGDHCQESRIAQHAIGTHSGSHGCLYARIPMTNGPYEWRPMRSDLQVGMHDLVITAPAAGACWERRGSEGKALGCHGAYTCNCCHSNTLFYCAVEALCAATTRRCRLALYEATQSRLSPSTFVQPTRAAHFCVRIACG